MKKVIIIFVLVALLATTVLAAKTYTIYGSYASPPNISLSLVKGGTLDVNRTFYYRAMTAQSYIAGGNYVSGLSETLNITTNSTHRSVNISMTHVTNASEYYAIFVANGTDPGVGMWASANSTMVSMLAQVTSASVFLTSYTVKGTSFVDNGTRLAYTRIGSSNYMMYLPHENRKDFILVETDDSSPVTLEDIYQYALANGWNLSATIDRVDYDTPGVDYAGRRPTYILNAKYLYLNKGSMEIMDCNVISFLWAFDQAIGTKMFIGKYDSNDWTYDGIDWTSFVHSGQYGKLVFRNAKIYDSKFRSRLLGASNAIPYSSTFTSVQDGANYTGEIIDTVVGSQFNSGMSLDWRYDGNVLRRVKNYDNRWETNTLYGFRGDVLDWKLHIADKGPWLRTSTTANSEITIRNVLLTQEGSIETRPFFVTPYHVGVTFYSMINLINPTLVESGWNYIYWYTTAALANDNAFVKRQYTFTVDTKDNDGAALSGANVTLTDNNGNTVFSVLTTNGTTGERIVTHTLYKPNLTLTSPHYQSQGRTTYYGPWDLTITYPGVMPVVVNNLDITENVKYSFRLGHIDTIILSKSGGATLTINK